MHKLILITLSQLFIILTYGQNNKAFHPPVNIPIYLSGNFGEIRTDHFHSGIDIKTQGTIGHHLFSVESGYVFRIKVQANGYGKSIYVTHPNGYTSVYGHLDAYREDIAGYVKKIQYTRHSHGVDIYLDKDEFILEKGEFIAYTGNTGGSSGPHLHFELRSSANQHPTNVLKYDFGIEDRIPPRFQSLYLYPIGHASHVNGSGEKLSTPIVKDNGVYTIPYGTKIHAGGALGISVEVYDFLNGASNRCGVYTLELFIDDQLTYQYVMDEFSFSESRYINAHIDYAEMISSGAKAHRLHRLPNDRLRLYHDLLNEGVVNINEDRNYKIRIVARDVAGNRSELRFNVRGDTKVQAPESHPPGFVKIMKYNEPNTFKQDQVSVVIPSKALYQDMEFSYEKSPPKHGSLSDFHHIGRIDIPLHLPYTFSINTKISDRSLVDKLLIITLNKDGEIEAAGGEYKDGEVVASLKRFGEYAIGLDSIAPQIIPVGGKISGDITGRKVLKFKIMDELSGIEKYEGYIDNQWALFEYDLKNDLLVYTFDQERITGKTNHELELYVTDSKGNVNLYHTTFTW